MRIYMQLPVVDNRPPRFYHLLLQEDMLGGWTLIKESGRQDAPGRVKREHYATRSEAQRALEKTRDAQLGRGYRVVFVQGEQSAGR